MATKQTAPKPQTKAETTEIVPVEWEFAALADAEVPLSELLSENLGGDGLRPSDLSVARFPGAGGEAWKVDGKNVSELIGVVLRQQVTRAFYASKFSGGDEPPDCASADGVNGIPNPEKTPQVVTADGEVMNYGGNCMKCPLNAWGSDLDGKRGKACREYRNLVFLRDVDDFPMVVRIPPTALGTWRDFAVEITKRRLPLSRVLVQLALVAPKGNTELQVEAVGLLTEETAGQLRTVATAMQQFQLAAPTDETALPEGAPDDDDIPF